MWRKLKQSELEEFELWANATFAINPEVEINPTWHPVVAVTLLRLKLKEAEAKLQMLQGD